MTRASAAPGRRTVLRAIATIVAVAAPAVLVGCGGAGTEPAPAVEVVAPSIRPTAPLPAGALPGTVVMVIRHGEKPDDATSGIDANGTEDESSLTAVGWDRAHRLVALFDPARGLLRPGLARPKTIYAARANDEGYGQRTRETVEPLADHLGFPVNIGYGKGEEEQLVEHVLTQPGPTLISWQHSEIPAIAEAFPGVTPTPPSEWPEDRFDVVWTFTRTAHGWHFAQLPELVLPQDTDTVIED
jgi:broad specificity phosphatase PhoE